MQLCEFTWGRGPQLSQNFVLRQPARPPNPVPSTLMKTALFYAGADILRWNCNLSSELHPLKALPARLSGESARLRESGGKLTHSIAAQGHVHGILD